MKFINNCFYFKSDVKMYELETSGAKRNTVRVLNNSEYNSFIDNKQLSPRICIGCGNNSFIFQLTSIEDITSYITAGLDANTNKHIIIFSW